MEIALRLAVALGITVLLPMLVYSGVSIVHPPPDRSDFRQESAPVKPQPGEIEQGQDETGQTRIETAEKEREELAQAEAMKEQWRAYDEASEAFTRVLFFIAIPVGLLALLLGGLIGNLALAPGLILGGLATLIMGYIQHWEHTDHSLRFATLAIGLIILLVIAWRRTAGSPAR